MSRFTVYAMFVLLLCTSPAFAAYNGTCIDASSFGNLTFCDMVDYSVYLAPGETIYGLDRLAQQMFFSKEYGTGGCETQARVLICSNVLRRCVADAPLPPCMSHCTAYTDCAQNDGSCEAMYFDDGKVPVANRPAVCSYIVGSDASRAFASMVVVIGLVFLLLL